MPTITEKEHEIHKAYGVDSILQNYHKLLNGTFRVSIGRDYGDCAWSMDAGFEADEKLATALEDFRRRKVNDLAQLLCEQGICPDCGERFTNSYHPDTRCQPNDKPSLETYFAPGADGRENAMATFKAKHPELLPPRK